MKWRLQFLYGTLVVCMCLIAGRQADARAQKMPSGAAGKSGKGSMVVSNRLATGKNHRKKKAACLVDVMAVRAGNWACAVVDVPAGRRKQKINCQVLIAGGGIGGVAAALSACRAGAHACLTEETDWLGGQLSSQGVAAPDENYLVETSGSALKYQQLRAMIRQHYAGKYQLSQKAAADQFLHPGNCWVSYISFEPKVAAGIIDALLKPYVDAGLLTIYRRTKPVSARLSAGKIKTVTMVNLDDGSLLEFQGRICLDATELGDLVAASGANYRTGSDCQADTGEPHAPADGDPENVQDFVFPFAVEWRPGERHVIDRPPHYDDFLAAGSFSLYGYKMFDKQVIVQKDGTTRELLPFWTYRRLLDRANFESAPYENDLAMINWMANDLRGHNIIDKPAPIIAERLALAKALSLGFLYWLQTEAPRDEGGKGYPELQLRCDVMGTADGLSKYPYIREARRIVGKHVICEQEIAEATTCGARAKLFDDAVGIGFYPIDIHGDQEKPGAAQATRPFQVPLGALLPGHPANLIAAGKSLGSTHITNGAYRLHPIEWTIGEAAGCLAAASLRWHKDPIEIWQATDSLRRLQLELVSCGVPIYWYDDVPVGHVNFAAIQFLAITGLLPGAEDNLHFLPNAPLTRGQAAASLASFLRLKKGEGISLPADVDASSDSGCAIAKCLGGGILQPGSDGLFHADEPLTWQELSETGLHGLQQETTAFAPGEPVSRAAFAAWLYEAAAKDEVLGQF